MSIDSFLGYREDTGGEEGRSGTKETEDVTWGPRDPQGLLKYGRNKGIAPKGRRFDGINKQDEKGNINSKCTQLIARATSTAPRLSHTSQQASSEAYKPRRVLSTRAAFSTSFDNTSGPVPETYPSP